MLINYNIFQDFGIHQEPYKPSTKPTLANILNSIYKTGTDATGPWIAGGMGRQLALDSGAVQFADIDVWFSSAASYEQCMLRLCKEFENDISETFTSDNAKTYTIGEHKVQLIRRAYYSSLADVFDNFDFTCCQVAVDRNFKISGPGIEDARNFVLRLNRLDTRGFLARYAKYVGYGYTMDNSTFLNIIDNEEINYEFDAATLGY